MDTESIQSKGLERAIQSVNGQKNLADALHVSQQAVSKWVKNGFVPMARAEEIEALTGVPRFELVDPALQKFMSQTAAASQGA